MEKKTEQKNENHQPAAQPQFLKSIVSPLDNRVEMGSIKLPKMCSCFSYGS